MRQAAQALILRTRMLMLASDGLYFQSSGVLEFQVIRRALQIGFQSDMTTNHKHDGILHYHLSRETKMKRINKLRIPVTRGLKDIYAMDMRLAYQAASLGQFNVVAFSRLAAAISVVRSALEQNQTKTPFAIETLDEAIETLQTVRKKGDETGIWEITEGELPSVLSGIDMAEQCIGTLDVALLAQTAELLLQNIFGEQGGQDK